MLLDIKRQTETDNNFFHKLINRFLGVFFRYLYHELAWAYDWVAAIVSLGRWATWIETSLPFLNGAKILELGHGPGHLIVKLTQSDRQIFGIDLSPRMSALAFARLKRSSLTANLSTAKSQRLPFAAQEFDHIIATFPTEYILEHDTLTEIYRVLKPDGSAVIIPVAYITGTHLVDKAAAWLFRITGQAPLFTDEAFAPATQLGFNVKITRKTLDNSEVVIIVVRKEAQSIKDDSLNERYQNKSLRNKRI
jgi:ubiquinone/menaquinone biosynthesis C-methylase UbiE